MSKKEPIYAGVKPMFPYNPCMVVGDDIWVAGQIGIDGGDSMAEQAASVIIKNRCTARRSRSRQSRFGYGHGAVRRYG